MYHNWNHIATVLDGDTYEINGLNIWEHKWIDSYERVSIKDPLYGQDYSISIYEITDGNKKERFAAVEFSNCVWGIYLEQR